MSGSGAASALKKSALLADNLKMGIDSSHPDPVRRAEALSSGRLPYRELQALYEDVSERLRKVSNEKDEVTLLAQQRQESFLRSEEKFKDDMRTLELRLRTLGQEDKSRMEPLRNLHENIQDTILSIQNKTARVLQDQERDLIRAFRARLADVTVELENERKKNESGSAEWVARCRKLTEELEWLRDLTDKLTSENKSVLKDNRRYKRQMKTQEEDREFLIKQLVSVKKENARLRYSFDQIVANGNGGGAGAATTGQQMAQQSLNPDQLLPGSVQANGGVVSSITGQPMSANNPLLRPALRAGTPITDAQGNRPTTGTSTPFGGAMRTPSLPSRPQSAFVGAAGSTARSSITGGGVPSRPATAINYSSTGSLGSVAGGAGAPLDDSKEHRYKSIISSLQRKVDDLTRRLRELRTAYNGEVSSRTELQSFLRRCIEDVRQDMAERGRSATLRRAQSAARARGGGKVSSVPPPPLDPRSIPLSEFTPTDRINVMEWLMSQDAVIFMLYEKMFPQAASSAAGGAQQPYSGHSASGQQQQHHSHGSAGDEFPPVGLESGAPGSLFYAPQQLSRPSSSPGSAQVMGGGGHTATTAAAAAGPRVRPQTSVGPGHSRAPSSTGSASSSSATQQQQQQSQQQRESTSTPGQIPSQYERPLGSRPLSGFDAMRASAAARAEAGASGVDSARSKRPHTASGYPSSAGGTAAQSSSSAAPASSSSSGLTAEERAEDEYQRAQRRVQQHHSSHDDDDFADDADADADEHLAADGFASAREQAGIGQLDPLSDEDEEQ